MPKLPHRVASRRNAEHDKDRRATMNQSEIRKKLLGNGYLPIPVNGKRPRIAGWSSIRATEATIESWDRGHIDHKNTGILAGDVVAIDVDVLDHELAAELGGMVRALPDGQKALCRVGRAPKCLYVFRAIEPRSKATTPVYLVGGHKCQIEVLGKGQQFVAFGLHPETGRDYEWIGDSPLNVRFADLPVIVPDDLDRFLAESESRMAAVGLPEKKHDKSSTQVLQGGETFWQRVNTSALANADAWVPSLFSGAHKEAGTGAWRVSSKELGRNLEEDISIHPDGVRDFGEEKPSTPIQLVIEYGGAATPKDAAFWLCERVSADPESMGWNQPQLGVSLNLNSAKQPPEAANDDKPQKRLNIFDWKASRFVGEPPSVDYLIDGIVPLGVPAMIAAMGDTGKSFVMMETARRVAFGEGAFAPPILGGHVRRNGTAVMITSEDDEGEVHRRLAALDMREDRYKSVADKLMVVPLPSAGGAMPFWRQGKDRGLEETPEFRQLVDQLLTIDDLMFVAIDPLASFAHLQINEDPAAGQFVCTSLSRVATETGATVMVAHHMKKTAKPVEKLSEARDAIRGSTALVDGLRLAYALWPAEEENAKKICRSIGKPYLHNSVAYGGVVKANGAARRILSTYHRNEFGLLEDITASNTDGVFTSQDDLSTILVISIESAAAAGSPYTKSGASGIFELREQLPSELKALSKGRLHAMVDDALERGQIVRCKARNEKTPKWLDVPTGPFAAGLGEFRAGMKRAG